MKVAAKIKIEGIKPILFHTFPIDTLDSGRGRKGSTGKDEEEWKSTVLMNEKRELYILSSYIIGAIREGGKHIKVGKGSLSKKVGSSLECSDDRIFLDGLKVPEEKELTKLTTDPVYLDIRSVVNPATKGRNLRYRIAAKPGWSFSTIMYWDDFAVSKEHMKVAVESAGIFDGIGDGRKIGFGRFKLISFEMLD